MTFINVGSINWFQWLVLVWLVISDLYLFHLIVLLNPDFNCSKKLLSSFIDKVTTGTYNFVSVILNVAFVGASVLSLAGLSPWASLAVCVVISVKTRFSDHVKVNDTSQLIEVMSKALQKLLNYFNGTTISRFFLIFVFPCSVPWLAFDAFPVILHLYLKDSEFVIGSALSLIVGGSLSLRGELLGSPL